MGWKCGKNNKQLCKKRTYAEAFSFLENHLTVSYNHVMLWSEDRNKLLQIACICEDEVDTLDDDALKENDDDGDGGREDVSREKT